MNNSIFFRFKYNSLPIVFIQIFAMVNIAYANVSDKQTQDDRRLQISDFDNTTIVKPKSVILEKPQPNVAVSVDEIMLLNNPELLARAMLSALLYNNIEGVSVLLPIYQKQAKESIEPQMITWANAVLATKNQDYPNAIKLYQNLNHEYPENQIFSTRLAQSLFANRQYNEAYHFITNDSKLASQMQPYLKTIDKLTKTNVRFDGNLIFDKNINNAPDKRDLGGNWTASEPLSAHGIALNGNFSKNFLFDKGLELKPDIKLRSKLYHDVKQYNEISVRSSLKVSKNNAKNGISMTPFHEITHYAGGKAEQNKLKHFSDSIGMQFNINTKINTKSQISVSGEFAKNFYQTRKHLNGYSISISPTFATSLQTFDNTWLNVGLGYQQTLTQDKDDSYRRIEANASISKQWQDIGVNANFELAKRTYLAPMPIFNKTQINREYNTSISIWHNKLRYKNIVPRLTLQHQKTHSSIPLYNYDKNRVFIELTGLF